MRLITTIICGVCFLAISIVILSFVPDEWDVFPYMLGGLSGLLAYVTGDVLADYLNEAR